MYAPLKTAMVYKAVFYLYIFTDFYDIIVTCKRKDEKMDGLKKLINVLAKNIGITLVFVVALIFFIWSCQGRLLSGLITAFAALIIYMSASMLYHEFKKSPKSKK